MSEVKRFMAPGPWVTRDLKECVRASDYDALAARLAEAERDAARYRWLTEDHADKATRERRDELLRRMPVMSYSAASRDIDIAMRDSTTGSAEASPK